MARSGSRPKLLRSTVAGKRPPDATGLEFHPRSGVPTRECDPSLLLDRDSPIIDSKAKLPDETTTHPRRWALRPGGVSMTARRSSLSILTNGAAAVLALLWLREPTRFETARASESKGRERIRAMARMPLYFVENRGQLDSRVAFSLQGTSKTLYFTREGVTIAMPGPGRIIRGPHLENASLRPEESGRRWIVKLDFVGANENVRIVGEKKTAAVVSYFKGPREHWKTGLATYGSILYSDLWPGIDLVFSGTANRLKYSF